MHIVRKSVFNSKAVDSMLGELQIRYRSTR